jgi:YVTN family beta-propeller protein
MNSRHVATRTVPAGRGPAWAAADEKRNRLYITGAMSDTVSVLDPIGERFIKELYVGKGPYGAIILDR